jgi:rubrerythrin
MMDSVLSFLAHAIRLEAAAAARSDELADAMQTWGNREVEAFFRRMAEYSRRHLKEALARAGFRQVSELPAEGFDWPDGVPPESSDWWAVDGLMGIEQAIENALAGEQRGLQYYEGVAARTSNARLRALAEEFAAEEREHVAELERMLQMQRQGGS